MPLEPGAPVRDVEVGGRNVVFAGLGYWLHGSELVSENTCSYAYLCWTHASAHCIGVSPYTLIHSMHVHTVKS